MIEGWGGLLLLRVNEQFSSPYPSLHIIIQLGRKTDASLSSSYSMSIPPCLFSLTLTHKGRSSTPCQKAKCHGRKGEKLFFCIEPNQTFWTNLWVLAIILIVLQVCKEGWAKKDFSCTHLQWAVLVCSHVVHLGTVNVFYTPEEIMVNIYSSW